MDDRKVQAGFRPQLEPTGICCDCKVKRSSPGPDKLLGPGFDPDTEMNH